MRIKTQNSKLLDGNLTYHVAGCFKGLYFLYFIFHSMTSLHRAHSPSCVVRRMFLVWWLVSCMVFLNAVEFLCFWALVRLTLPFWELMLR